MYCQYMFCIQIKDTVNMVMINTPHDLLSDIIGM